MFRTVGRYLYLRMQQSSKLLASRFSLIIKTVHSDVKLSILSVRLYHGELVVNGNWVFSPSQETSLSHLG